jgi:hypothetical protein
MIVIVIVGVVYTLAITKLKSIKEDSLKPNLTNLKIYLSSFSKENVADVRIFCFDDCSDCSIYVDGKKVKDIDGFLDSNVEVYRYDHLQGAILEDNEIFFNDENVEQNICFSFRIDKNNVADQSIIVYKGKAYDYSNYFTKTKVYDSLEDAVQARQDLAQEVIK